MEENLKYKSTKAELRERRL